MRNAAPARAIKVATDAVQHLGYAVIKPEQLQVVSGIISGRDVLAVLPTGFSNSLCFVCLLAVFDRVLPIGEPSIFLAVAPLTAIMKDQVSI